MAVIRAFLGILQFEKATQSIILRELSSPMIQQPFAVRWRGTLRRYEQLQGIGQFFDYFFR